MQVAKGRVWTFRELIAHDDEAFVAAAYLAALGRPPGQAERFYLEHLRRGVSKTRILRELMRSEEGRRFGAHIDGLQLPAALDAARSAPLIGRVVGILADLVNLPGLTATTRMLQSRVAQLGTARTPAAPKGDSESVGVDVDQHLDLLRSQMANLIDLRHQRMQRQIMEIMETLSECADQISTLSGRTSQRDAELDSALRSMRSSVEELRRSVAAKEELR